MNDGNLKPFLKGISGNPKGRPKGSKSITSSLKKLMDKKMIYDSIQSGISIKANIREHLALRLVALALEGDIKAIREIFDRIEGRPREAICEVVEHDPFGHLTKEQIDDIIRIRDGD